MPNSNLEHTTQKQESASQRKPTKLCSSPPASFSLLPPMDSEIQFIFNDYIACNKTGVSWLLGYCVGNPRPRIQFELPGIIAGRPGLHLAPGELFL
jgi:hypothetical protein